MADKTAGARIVRINGPVVGVEGGDLSMTEMVYVGRERLIGEVISLSGSEATVQVYEETVGLGIGEPARLPAPQEQDEDEYGGQTAGRQQEKQGKGHGCSVVFDCKNSNLFPESEFWGPCVILFAPDGISCAEFYNFVSY